MKRLLLIIAVALLSVSALFAQQPDNVTEIESLTLTPDPVGRGDIFTMTVVVDHDSSADVEISLDNLPSDITLWRGPYIRSFIDTGKKNETIRKVRITASFKAWSTGRGVFPSLPVEVNGETYMTPERMLSVGLYRNRQLYIPLKVEWRAGFDNVYAGEAVPLYLTVAGQDKVTLFDRVRVAMPAEGFFEEAPDLGSIETSGAGGVVLYDIPAAAYIFTPPSAGRVKIPAAGVDAEGQTGWTDSLDIDVKPLPRGVAATGAVGDFRYSFSLDESGLERDGTVVLTVRVDGDGNLNFLRLPEPAGPGVSVLAASESSGYTESAAGYTGYKEVSYHLGFDSSGRLSVEVPPFAYLAKSRGEVVLLPGRSFSVEVRDLSVQVEPEEPEVFPFSAVEEGGRVWKDYYRNGKSWLWFLPAGIFYVVFRINRGRRLGFSVVIAAVSVVVVFSTINALYKTPELPHPADSPQQLYNGAIYALQAGAYPEALHLLRCSIYADPLGEPAREALVWAERKAGIRYSLEAPPRLHPDVFFVLCIIGVNALFAAAAFRLRRPGGIVTVVFIMLAACVVSAAGLTLYSHNVRNEVSAVVLSDSAGLKKIPRDSAARWLDLEPGTPLRVRDSSGGYFLVETGLGVQGWIDTSVVGTDRDGSR